ncbi:MAG: hypothetical protein KA004_06840 [Verrucomicrobiales bacterium]|nr:hypothetical protein [Verrucomicrobiales bacterium]
MNDPLPPPPAMPAAPRHKFPVVHVIFAALLLVFVCGGYIPSLDPPKPDLETALRIPHKATDEQKKKLEEDNKKIAERNQEKTEEAATELDEWRNGGQERMEKWLAFCRFGALLIAALWLIYCVVAYLINPLLGFLARFVGPEFAAVLSPLILLGLFSVLARILQNASQSIQTKSGFMAAGIQYVKHIIDPACAAAISFADLVLRNWVVGSAYLVVVIYTVLRKYIRPVN